MEIIQNCFLYLAVKITNPIGPTSVEELIIKIVDYVIPITGLISVAFLVYGGIQYMTAGGADDKIKSAVKTITGAIIGLIIVFAAVAIRNTVFSAIGKRDF